MHDVQNYSQIKVPNSNVSKFNEVEEFSSRDEKIVDEFAADSTFSPIIKNESIRTKANDIQFTEEIEMRGKESKVQQINIKSTKNSSTANLISQNKLCDKENTKTHTKRDDNQEQRCISYNKEASDALENTTQSSDNSLTQIPTQFVSNKHILEKHMDKNSFVISQQSTKRPFDKAVSDIIQDNSTKNDGDLEREDMALNYYNNEIEIATTKDSKIQQKNNKVVSI